MPEPSLSMRPQAPAISVLVLFILSTTCSPSIAQEPTQSQSLTPIPSSPEQAPASILDVAAAQPPLPAPPPLVNSEQIKEFAGVVKEKLPEILNKEKIRKLADHVTGIMPGSGFGLKTINLENIPSPIAMHDAYYETLERFLPEIFPDMKVIPKLISMMKFYRETLRQSPEKLFEKH